MLAIAISWLLKGMVETLPPVSPRLMDNAARSDVRIASNKEGHGVSPMSALWHCKHASTGDGPCGGKGGTVVSGNCKRRPVISPVSHR